MKTTNIIIFIALILVGCENVKDNANEAINQGGEVAGQVASQFVSGVSNGVDKTYLPELIMSEWLKRDGVKNGKYTISEDTLGGNDNLLSLYLIFDKDFKKDITVKAFGSDGLEIGRVKVVVDKKKGDACYFDFHFDKRTEIGAKCKLVVE